MIIVRYIFDLKPPGLPPRRIIYEIERSTYMTAGRGTFGAGRREGRMSTRFRASAGKMSFFLEEKKLE